MEDALATFSQSPDLKWMAALQCDNRVQWNAVIAQSQEWDYEAEGLTAPAAALIAIALAAAAAPLAGSVAGSLSGVTAATAAGGTATASQLAVQAAINAGIKTMVSRAGVSLINNKGDLSATLRDLGSSDSLKSLAVAMISAGVTTHLNTTVFADVPKGYDLNALSQQLVRDVTQAAVRTSISTAIQGGDFGDQLQDNVINAAVGVALRKVQFEIGEIADIKEGSVRHAVLHAVAGCAAAEVQGATCAAGAAAAVVQSIYAGSLEGREIDDEKAAQVSEILGAVAGLIFADGDAENVNVAAQVARSGFVNNYLNHKEAYDREIARSQCEAGDDAGCSEVERLDALDQLRDEQLIQACSSGSRSECTSHFRTFYAAMVSYHTEPPSHYATQEEYLAAVGNAYVGMLAEYNQSNRLLAGLSNNPSGAQALDAIYREELVKNHSTALRLLLGIAQAANGTIAGLGEFSAMLVNDPGQVKRTALAIYEDPSLVPEAMWEPFKLRIEAGDYAGALGYATVGLADIAVGTKGVTTSVRNGTELVSALKANATNKPVKPLVDPSTNVASPQRTQHILFGDATGGGHLWPGLPGKTPFPKDWDSNKVMATVSDIATDPNLLWKPQTGNGSLYTKSGKPARFIVTDSSGNLPKVDGVPVKVVIEPATNNIITAHPKY